MINFYGGTILYEADKIPTRRLFGCRSPSDPNAPCHADALDASPILHVAASNPPFLIFHGEDDEANREAIERVPGVAPPSAAAQLSTRKLSMHE